MYHTRTFMDKDKRFRDVLNFRDLGGYKTSDNKTVKYNLIYRSSSLGFMNSEELEVLKDLKINTILDLRSNLETSTYPDPSIGEIKRIEKALVISGDKVAIDFSLKGMRQSGEKGIEQLHKLTAYYNKLPFGNEAIQVLFDELLNENIPLLFHCASGKDRTGLAAILILLALGVSEEDVKENYLLSNEYRKSILEETLKDIDKDKEPELYELMLMFDGVSENIFEIIINTIHNKYDSYNEYFEKEYVLDESKLKKLKDLYTE